MSASKSIQVDMFSVGLGAAILVQVRKPDGGVVRILADGGMGHGGYIAEGVRDRLPAAMAAFGAAPHDRVDLIVGTHYDGDHLKGLVPIAESNLGIGEVWLPPVKDDSGDVSGLAGDGAPFLADRFFDDRDGTAFRRYTQAKVAEVQDLYRQEQRAWESLQEQSESSENEERPAFREHIVRESPPELLQESMDSGNPEQLKKFFREHEWHAANILGSGRDHEAAEYDSLSPDLKTVALMLHENFPRTFWRQRERELERPRAAEMFAEYKPTILAGIRKSTAASAITAIHLHELVQALKRRQSPIRPVCKYIDAGKPVRFLWESVPRRFLAGSASGKSDVILDLLAPSKLLVDKHRDKLPIGMYLAALPFHKDFIEKKPITASNQLSYVLTLEAFGQRILITGDAGCYDFRDAKHSFYPSLSRLLAPLHVVQIAHHAGNNYDFYNALNNSKFASHGEPTHLLLSHAVNDKTRPSPAFGKFVAQVGKDGGDLCLLFTSKPDASKVAAFKNLFAGVAPAGGSNNEGDARLHYRQDEKGGRWQVDLHAVAG